MTNLIAIFIVLYAVQLIDVFCISSLKIETKKEFIFAITPFSYLVRVIYFYKGLK